MTEREPRKSELIFGCVWNEMRNLCNYVWCGKRLLRNETMTHGILSQTEEENALLADFETRCRKCVYKYGKEEREYYDGWCYMFEKFQVVCAKFRAKKIRDPQPDENRKAKKTELVDFSTYEGIMKEWDRWREYIAEGGRGSWPREAFESLLEYFDEELTRLRVENKRLLDEIGAKDQ